jgi:hypothetical protein
MFAMPVMAGALPSVNEAKPNMNAPLPALNNIAKFDPNLPNETILSNSGNLSKLLNSQNVEILSSYGVNTKNASSVRTVKDNINDRTISQVRFSGLCSVGFDDNNNISFNF